MKTFLRFLVLSAIVFAFSLTTYAQVKSLSETKKLSKSELLKLRQEITQKGLKKASPLNVATPPPPSGVTYYTSRSIFSSLSLGLATEDFHQGDARIGDHAISNIGTTVLNSSTNVYYFQSGDIVPGIQISGEFGTEIDICGPFFIGWSFNQLSNPHSIITPDQFEDHTVLDFSPAVELVGFDLYPFFTEDFTTVSIFDQNGDEIHTTESMSTFNGTFFGVRSVNKKIARIVLNKDNGSAFGDCELVGNIQFGNVTKNPPPFLSNMEAWNLAYGNKPAVKMITGSTTVSGPATCSGAVIKIKENYQKGKELLMLNPGTGLMNTFNINTGTLTITGLAPTSVYQNALRNIIYLLAIPNIPNSTPTRKVEFTVYNGVLQSNTVHRLIVFGEIEKSVGEASLDAQQLPTEFNLYPNYPNPFNPVTNIRFAIPTEGFTTLKVYNLLGQEVASLMNDDLQAGTYQVQFDGSKLSSGTYFYRLTSGNFVETKKFLLMK